MVRYAPLSAGENLVPAFKGSAATTLQTSKTVYPKVISASRATDIPAFHAAWLMEHLRLGQCDWRNPFNANQRQTVSFDETEMIVFWSKNPAPLIPYLDEISDKGRKFYFQFTLNNYEKDLEPDVPELDERIATFISLAQKYKVIWRYDPVIMGDRLKIKWHMRSIESLMRQIGGCAEKLVFSFVDLYGSVRDTLKKHGTEWRAPRLDEMEQFSQDLAELRDKLAPSLKLATCAEADLDLSRMGIEKNRCIDPVLINELLGHEMYKPKRPRQQAEQICLFPDDNPPRTLHYEKDKGQRADCLCAPSKDIGSYWLHRCGHHCVYCYAHHALKSG